MWLTIMARYPIVNQKVECCQHAARRALEDDRPPLVDQHPVLEVPADRAGQHAALDVATDLGELLDRVAVIDALDVLLDDRPRVELLGDVVRRGADDLHPAL